MMWMVAGVLTVGCIILGTFLYFGWPTQTRQCFFCNEFVSVTLPRSTPLSPNTWICHCGASNPPSDEPPPPPPPSSYPSTPQGIQEEPSQASHLCPDCIRKQQVLVSTLATWNPPDENDENDDVRPDNAGEGFLDPRGFDSYQEFKAEAEKAAVLCGQCALVVHSTLMRQRVQFQLASWGTHTPLGLPVVAPLLPAIDIHSYQIVSALVWIGVGVSAYLSLTPHHGPTAFVDSLAWGSTPGWQTGLGLGLVAAAIRYAVAHPIIRSSQAFPYACALLAAFPLPGFLFSDQSVAVLVLWIGLVAWFVAEYSVFLFVASLAVLESGFLDSDHTSPLEPSGDVAGVKNKRWAWVHEVGGATVFLLLLSLTWSPPTQFATPLLWAGIVVVWAGVLERGFVHPDHQVLGLSRMYLLVSVAVVGHACLGIVLAPRHAAVLEGVVGTGWRVAPLVVVYLLSR